MGHSIAEENAAEVRVVHTGQAWHRLDEAPGCVVVTVGGEVDMHTAPGLRQAVHAAANRCPRLVIDLTQVTFLDSTGLGVLVGVYRRSQDEDAAVSVVVAPGPVPRLFAITGLHRLFGVYHQLEDAVAANAHAA